MSETANLLRLLPSIDSLLQSQTAVSARERVGPKQLTNLARLVLAEMRAEMKKSVGERFDAISAQPDLLRRAEFLLEQLVKRDFRAGMTRVINATGVILHTNLGRAPLSAAAISAILEAGSHYSNLEYDLGSGRRGRRGAHVEDLLIEYSGAAAATIVNNCAAAVLLVLTALAAGGEGLISRGELVEIGGDFRIPDVMRASGTSLVEVGTTNRTRLSDYADAINDKTRIIMRVHPSNYRIMGFTSSPKLSGLVDLAHNSGVPFFLDAGSGAMMNLDEYGVSDEPVIAESASNGVDVITFSGDKLLGGPQAGIIVGTIECIERIRAHPLFRALRAGKLVLSALEGTMSSYRRETQLKDIPVLRMLSEQSAAIESRARNLVAKLVDAKSKMCFELMPGASAVGGGAAPITTLPTFEIAITHKSLSSDELDELLRSSSPPVIGKISEDSVRLDLRTVGVEQEFALFHVLNSISTELSD